MVKLLDVFEEPDVAYLSYEYMAGGDSPLAALAGKGISFDTGGISLKGNDGMWAMKGDLGGAGIG